MLKHKNFFIFIPHASFIVFISIIITHKEIKPVITYNLY